MHERFLEDVLGGVEIRLTGVNQQVFIPSAKGIHALVNPDRLHVVPDAPRQPPDHGGILLGLPPRRVNVAELGVYLNLDVRGVGKAGIEQERIEIHPTGPPVVHRSFSGSRILDLRERRGIGIPDHVGIQKDRTMIGRFAKSQAHRQKQPDRDRRKPKKQRIVRIHFLYGIPFKNLRDKVALPGKDVKISNKKVANYSQC
jgi:hypothetical protein